MRWYGKMTPTRTRFVLLVTLIVALAVSAALLPLRRIPDATADLGAWGPVVAIVLGALLLAALVPRTAISLACGALFGVIGGGFVALGAAVVAFVVTFVIGRWLGRDAIAARTGGRIANLDAWLNRTGLLSVIVVRLLPIAPYGLVGYVYGTTSVRVRNYLLGSLIGATPSAFTYAAVGAAVVRPGAVGLVTFAPAAAGLVVTAAAAVYWYRTGRRARPPSQPDRDGAEPHERSRTS
ncbi:MAG TPA: VTT domain-containing protein [Micromonosporaceae bacterium]|nr:VTT domain-containing protein [Micromonosporaceae bacterium]